MSILEKQILKVNEKALMESLQKGRTPTVKELALKISRFLSHADAGPIMRPRFQKFQQRWDHHATNQVFEDLQFDLEVLYAELLEQVSQQVQRAGFIELAHASQSREIDRILSLLENLLLAAKNTADNFQIVYDTFDDLSKTDLTKTSRDVVDLNAGVLLLPNNEGATDRVDMSHLYERHQWAFDVQASPTQVDSGVPDGGATTPGETPATVVQNETVDQAWFGNAWQDMINSWRQIVTTSNNNGCSVTFVVPITGYDDKEITISRVAVASSSALPMHVSILHSNDNVNWLKFPGLNDAYTVQPGRTVYMDFAETRVQYVRFKLTTDEATYVNEPSFSYVYGVRGIAFYKMGRAQEAEFFSKPLRPTDMVGSIDKVALEVQSEIPEDCTIDYFVAAANTDSEPRNDIWLPILPVGMAGGDAVPNIIAFTESGRATQTIMAADTPVVYDTVRNIPFYQLTTTALEHEPLFKSARLYRGENAWYRNTNREVEVRQMRDAFIDFTTGDVQPLYAIKVDEPDVSRTTLTWRGVLGTEHTLLTVSSDIYYQDTTMPLVPPQGSDPGADEQPNYAIYRIERIRDEMSIANSPITLRGSAYSQLVDSNGNNAYWIDKGVRPTITNAIAFVNMNGAKATAYQYTIDDSAKTITRTSEGSGGSGSWASDGFVVGNRIQTASPYSGTSVYTITVVTDAVITVSEAITAASWAGPGTQVWEVQEYAANEFYYTEGTDYLLEGVAPGAPGAGTLTGRIQRPATGSNIPDGSTVSVSYNLTSDITQMVQGVDEKNIHLSHYLGEVADQYFRVSYRFIPKIGDATVVKSSIIVSSGFGTPSNERVYTEGPDYIVDAERATITRMTQVNGGAIPDNGTVYIDFAYRIDPKDLETFSTWLWVATKEPVHVEHSALSLDVEYGERVAVNGVDVSTKVSWPELDYGWHQVVVRSRRPEAFADAAIKQIATLRDRNGKAVLIAGGLFARMVAKRMPMKQVKYLQLTKSIVPSNHDYFAILSSRHVVVNFQPGQTDELYTFGLRSENGTITEQERSEEYTLEYSYPLETTEPTDYVLFRALLRRSSSTDSGAVTPKLHSYNIRVAQ